MEEKVEVICRSTDVKIVQSASKEAESAFKEKSGRETKVEVKEGLEKDSHGGVILAGHGGRIRINQTLDERLRLLEERMLPEIRMDLFGPNDNRKFYN